jgi:hypothetical protein
LPKPTVKPALLEVYQTVDGFSKTTLGMTYE